MDEFLIIRLSSLGDIIHALPAFSVLRKGYPESRIAWVVDRSGKEILDLVPGLDEIIVRGEKGWFRALRKRARTAIDFQGLQKSAVIGRISGARRRIGFSGANLRESAAGLFYTDKLPEFVEDGHVIQKNLGLLSLIGLKPRSEAFEFPLKVPEDTRQSVREALGDLGWDSVRQKIVICNVGAAWENKRWPRERWIEFLNMTDKEGLFHVILWGNAAEREAALAIGAATGIPAAPYLSIKQVLAFIAESSLLISGDTFALQAACALDIPVVAIFGPTNPVRNGPFRGRDKVAGADLDCRPCWKRSCPSPKCMNDITGAQVSALAKECLERHA